MWKNFETRFRGILDSLTRHRQLIANQAEAIHYQQYQLDSQEMFRYIQQYEHDRIQNIETRDRQEQSEMDRKYLEVLQWFSATDTTKSDQELYTRTRREYPGTGDWILKNEKVRNWQEDDTPTSSILWLNGKPGAGNLPTQVTKYTLVTKNSTGKTVLASVVVEDCVQNQDFYTAYFYCEESEPRKHDCISVLKALLSQLLCNCRELVPYCFEK